MQEQKQIILTEIIKTSTNKSSIELIIKQQIINKTTFNNAKIINYDIIPKTKTILSNLLKNNITRPFVICN